MPQPVEAAAIEDPLIRAYATAWERVVAEQQELADDPLRLSRRRRLAEMRARIESIMDELDEMSSSWLKSQLPKAYALGGAAGVAEATGGAAQFVWTQIHQEAVQRLATGLFHELLASTNGVRDSTKRLIREVARDKALGRAIEGKTAVQAGREMRRVLESKGIHSVRYSDGSKHGLKEYSQMAIRTTTAKAYNEGTINGASGEGVKFWEVFDGPSCGWSTHEDPLLALGRIVTRDEALGFPISHPNCRRTFGARPDVTTKTQAKTAERSVDVEALREAGEGGVPTPAAKAHKRAEARDRKVQARQVKTGEQAPLPPSGALLDELKPGFKYVDHVPSVESLVDGGMTHSAALGEHARLLKNARNRDRRARNKVKGQTQTLMQQDAQLPAGSQPLALYDAPADGVLGVDYGPGAVAGERWWTALKQDTAPGTFVPVQRLTIQSYRVESGIAIRRNGRVYLMETPTGQTVSDAMRLELEQVVTKTESVFANIPEHLRPHQQAVAVVRSSNPADEFWAQKYGKPGFHSNATGGNGQTVFWNTEVKPGLLMHEFGHNVDSAYSGAGKWASEQAGSVVVPQPGALSVTPGSWDEAVKRDVYSSSYHGIAGFKTTIYGGEPITLGGKGVTNYGALDVREDFAESVRLYLTDRHTGYVGYSGSTSVRFADVFPERSAFLDKVFGFDTIETPFQKSAYKKAVDLASEGQESLVALQSQTGVTRLRAQQAVAEAKSKAQAAAAEFAAKQAAAAAAAKKVMTAADLSFADKTGIGVKASNAKKAALKAGKSPAEAQQVFNEAKATLTYQRLQELGGGGQEAIKSTAASAGRMTPGAKPGARTKGGSFLNQAGQTKHPLAKQQPYGTAGQAKANIAAELGRRLNNREDWEIFRKMKTDSGDFSLKPFDELTEDVRQRFLDKEASNRVQAWASSSGDSQLHPVMMQRAIKEEFGTTGDWFVRGSSNEAYNVKLRKDIEDQWPVHRAFYRRFVRRMYENTQEELAKAGITEINVSRGMNFNSGRPAWAAHNSVSRPDLQPANSWSTSEAVAKRFGHTRFRATFPADRILGSARTGFGCLNEKEFVILVSDGEAEVGLF